MHSSGSIQRLQRRIQLAPLRVARLVRGEIRRIWLDALRHFDRLPACLVETGPVARAHAGHQRATKRAAFFGGQHFHRLPVNAGLNLAPQRTARTSAAQPDCADRNSQSRQTA